MADYKELLRRGVAALPENNGASRRALYEKARTALVGELRKIRPMLPARDITQHRLQLEDQIRQVEQESSEAVVMGRRLEPAPIDATRVPDDGSGSFKAPPVFAPVSDTVREDLIRRGVAVLPSLQQAAEPNPDRPADSVEEAIELVISSLDADTLRPLPTEAVIKPTPQAVIAPPEGAAAPAQMRSATVFHVSSKGISIEARQVLETLSDGPDQREAYDSLRSEVNSLIAGSANLLGDAGDSLVTLASALPEDMSEARVFRLWRAGNKVRRLHRAHLLVVDQPDGHPSTLDPAIAELVGGICDEFNNLAATDPGLKQRDLWRVSPQNIKPATEEFKSGNSLIELAVTANIASPDVVAEVSPDGLIDPKGMVVDLLVPEIDLVNQVRRNFFAALIGAAFDTAKRLAAAGVREVAHAARTIMDGLYSNVGTGIGIAMLAYVVTNSAVRNYAVNVLKSPQAVAAIDWMIKVFGSP
ncbi:hypothetical protein ACLI1C_12060 [Devosia sp. XGJD_8]|uniref:hypothetical protein n=1 Tax=Devosia sp. XGJD_8 TaxID=3391187 RepID=UPI003984F6D2